MTHPAQLWDKCFAPNGMNHFFRGILINDKCKNLAHYFPEKKIHFSSQIFKYNSALFDVCHFSSTSDYIMTLTIKFSPKMTHVRWGEFDILEHDLEYLERIFGSFRKQSSSMIHGGWGEVNFQTKKLIFCLF